jgi:quinol monooxygenase YgiN
MNISEKEKKDLEKFFKGVKDLIEATESEKTNVGMPLYRQCKEWLIKLGE